MRDGSPNLYTARLNDLRAVDARLLSLTFRKKTYGEGIHR